MIPLHFYVSEIDIHMVFGAHGSGLFLLSCLEDVRTAHIAVHNYTSRMKFKKNRFPDMQRDDFPDKQ